MHYLNDGNRLIVLGIGEMDFQDKADFALEIRDQLLNVFQEENQTKPNITVQLSCDQKDFKIKRLESEFDTGANFETEDEVQLKNDIKEVTEGEHGFILRFENEDHCELATRIFDQAFGDGEIDEDDLTELVEEFEEYWETSDGERCKPGKSDFEESVDVIKDVVGNRKIKSPEALLALLIKEGLYDEDDKHSTKELNLILEAL